MSEKILFVDDEPAILDGYRRLLRADYEINTAAGGTLALEMLANDSGNGWRAIIVQNCAEIPRRYAHHAHR